LQVLDTIVTTVRYRCNNPIIDLKCNHQTTVIFCVSKSCFLVSRSREIPSLEIVVTNRD